MATACVVYERPLDDIGRGVYLTICLYLALLQKGFKIVIEVLEFILWKICVYVCVFHMNMHMAYTTHQFNVFECFPIAIGGENPAYNIFFSKGDFLDYISLSLAFQIMSDLAPLDFSNIFILLFSCSLYVV